MSINDSVRHSGNGIPTPYLCTVIDNGHTTVCEPLLLPDDKFMFTSLTYTSRLLYDGHRVSFTVRLTPDHLRPYRDMVNITEVQFLEGFPPHILQRASSFTENDFLAFRAVNRLGIQLIVTKTQPPLYIKPPLYKAVQ